MQRRDRMVNFRLTNREVDELEERAAAQGRSVGGYLRDVLGFPRDALPDRSTPYELRQAGRT